MVYYNLQWSRIAFSMKKQEEKDIDKDNAQALVTENRGRSETRNSKGRGKFRSQLESKGKFKHFYSDKVRRNYKAWKNNHRVEKNQNKVRNRIPLLPRQLKIWCTL